MNEFYPDTWHNHEFRAMGCMMAVWLETQNPDSATIAFDKVERLFAANEQALSRFRPDSELSWLNSRTGHWVIVSDLMWNVLTIALEMAAVTNGHFDPTILNALERIGYMTTFDQLGLVDQAGFDINGMLTTGNWKVVKTDVKKQAIYIPDGLRLDLGGIAKGYTAQQAVELIRTYGPCLVDAGGDLASGDAPDGYPGWPVAISSPWTGVAGNTFDMCQLWLANQALASSGIDYRTWDMDGQTQHHIIDPVTYAPANTDCLTVTILDGMAAQAEAWATAALVAGSEAGMDALLEAELAGLMVTQSGAILVTPPMRQALQLLPET